MTENVSIMYSILHFMTFLTGKKGNLAEHPSSVDNVWRKDGG